MTDQGQPGTASAGTDPAYVPDREVFDAYTHQQIWDLARERLAPAELRRVADTWGYAADALESAFDEHARDITRLSGEWSGVAAAAAARSATALVRAGADTAGVCRVLQQLMAANSDAAEAVRVAVPPPPPPYRPDPDSAVEAATGAQRRTAYNLAVAAAAATAQDAMTFGYNPTIPASGDSVPVFPAVKTPAPETPGAPELTVPRGTTTPNTEPATAVGPESGSPVTTPAGPPAPDSAPAPDSGAAPGRAGEDPQPLLGHEATPPTAGSEDEPQSPGEPSAVPPQTSATAGPPTESAPPADAAAPDASPPTEASAADTTPAAGSAPATRPAGSETEIPPVPSPIDRGTGPAGSADPARPPGSSPATGAVAPIPVGASPSGPSTFSPPGSGVAVPPGPSSPTGGTSAPQPASGANPPPTRTVPGVPPTSAGAPGGAAASGAPPAPDSSARLPAGRTDPIDRAPLPGDREVLGPAGTGPHGAPADGNDHPGHRPVRLVPTGVPLTSPAGTSAPRTVDAERACPDYLHAPNEELTATDPKVPPVLGEYTEAERAERGDPGGGSR